MRTLDKQEVSESIESLKSFFVNYDFDPQSSYGDYDLVSKDANLKVLSNVYTPNSLIQNMFAFTNTKDFVNIRGAEAEELSKMRRDDYMYSAKRNSIAMAVSFVPYVGIPLSAAYYMSGLDDYFAKEQNMKYNIYYSGRRNIGSDFSNRAKDDNSFINYGFTANEATLAHKKYISSRKKYGYMAGEASDLFNSADRSGYFKIKQDNATKEYDDKMVKLYKDSYTAMQDLMLTASQTGELFGILEQYQVKNKVSAINKFDKIQKKLGIGPKGIMTMASDLSSFMQGYGFIREGTLSGGLDIIGGFSNDRYDPNLKVGASKKAMDDLFGKNSKLMLSLYTIKDGNISLNQGLINNILSGDMEMSGIYGNRNNLMNIADENEKKMTPVQVKLAMTPQFLQLSGIDIKTLDMVSKRIFDIDLKQKTMIMRGVVEVINRKGNNILQKANNPGGLTSGSGKLIYGSNKIWKSPRGKYNYLGFKTIGEGIDAAKKVLNSSLYSNLTVKDAIYKWKNLNDRTEKTASEANSIYESMYNLPIFPLMKDIGKEQLSSLSEEGKNNLLNSIFEQEGFYSAEEYRLEDGSIISSKDLQESVEIEYLNNGINRELFQSDWKSPVKEDDLQSKRFVSEMFKGLTWKEKNTASYCDNKLKYDDNKKTRQENIILAIKNRDGSVSDKTEVKTAYYDFKNSPIVYNKDVSKSSWGEKHGSSSYQKIWDSINSEYDNYNKYSGSKFNKSIQEFLYSKLLSMDKDKIEDTIEYGVSKGFINQDDMLEIAKTAAASHMSLTGDRSFFSNDISLNISEYFDKKFGFKKGTRSDKLYSTKDFNDFISTKKITKNMTSIIRDIAGNDAYKVISKMSSSSLSNEEVRILKELKSIELYETFDDNVNDLKSSVDGLCQALKTTEGKVNVFKSFVKLKNSNKKMYMTEAYMLAGSLNDDPSKNYKYFEKYFVSSIYRMFPGAIVTSTVRSRGNRESKHNKGLAVDFFVPCYDQDDVVKKIFESGLPITELFSETNSQGKNWVHYAYDPSDKKRIIQKIKVGISGVDIYTDVPGVPKYGA